MDDLIERIENARTDADWGAAEGMTNGIDVMLSREDCAAISAILTKAFGCALMGKRDADLADMLARLAGAFEGDSRVDDDDSEEA